MRKILAAILLIGLCSLGLAQTLAEVQDRGVLRCGIGQANTPGFGTINDQGVWEGIDADYCRAVAAAVLGDSEAVEYRQLSSQERFTALQTGEVDVLIRTTTWTSSRDTALGLNFTATTYYDGQGFMVRGNSGIASIEDMDGASICVQSGTTTELNVADTMAANDIDWEPILVANADQALSNYESGACDAYTTDSSALNGQRTKLANPSEHIILAEKISKEPLGPSVRHGDDQWFDAVQWTVFATFLADEWRINMDNVDDAAASSEVPDIQRLLGILPDNVEQLGLDASAFLNVIAQVGNYSDIYDRNLGPDTPTYIPRGLNASYVDGGIHYAPPVR